MINSKYFVKEGYKVNSMGYRAPEFNTVDWANSYILQGCSATFGVGIPDDSKTVSANLEKKLNAPVINLGVSGTGVQFQYMNAVEMLEENIKPKGVFIVWPNSDRFPYMGKGSIQNIGPWSEKKYLKWMLDDNSRSHNLYHARAYKLLWKLAGVPLYEVTHHNTNCIIGMCDTYVGDFKDRGDDGLHWGPVMAEHVASLLYQKHLLNQNAK